MVRVSSVRFHDALDGSFGKPEDAIPHPDNPNNGDVEEIRRSIRANGCYRHVWVSKKTRHIVGGHHLHQALVEEGAEKIPYLWLDLADADAEARVLLADNAIARKSWIDTGLELALARQLEESEIGLYGSGISEEDLARMIRDEEESLGDALGRAFSAGDRSSEIECPSCGHHFSVDLNLEALESEL